MYERFTDRARKVMTLANQEALRFNHEYVGTEHLLLGLVKEGSGVGANVLKNFGIDLRKVRLEVEKLVRSGPDNVEMGKMPLTPRAKKVLEHSAEEARDLGHNHVGTEHLLLGLCRGSDDVACRVLKSLLKDVQLKDVQQEVSSLLGVNKVPVALEKFAKPAEGQENLAPFSFRFIEPEARYELLDSTGSVIQTKVFGGPVGAYVFNAMSKHEKSQALLRDLSNFLDELGTVTNKDLLRRIAGILDHQ